MNRTLSEQKVLKKLDIPDFRHLTKDKIIAFASLLPQMDTEVAKKALEQFPNFASTSLEVMREYKSILENAIVSNSETTKASIDMYNQVTISLQKMVDDENLTFDERVYILEQMKEIAILVDKKDTESKNTTLKIIGIAGTVALGLVAALSATLGSNVATSLPSDDEEM